MWSSVVEKYFAINPAIFLKLVTNLRKIQRVNSYLVFVFKPLHNLYHKISKLVKEDLKRYLSSDRLGAEGV